MAQVKRCGPVSLKSSLKHNHDNDLLLVSCVPCQSFVLLNFLVIKGRFLKICISLSRIIRIPMTKTRADDIIREDDMIDDLHFLRKI